MLKSLLSSLFIFFISVYALSQNAKDNETRLKNGEDLNVLYRNEASGAIYAHTAIGFGLAYRRGWQVNVTRKRMFELELQNFKNPKEIKTVNSAGQGARGYFYGKLNSFFIFRPGIGFQNILYQRSDKKSVEIRYSYFIGATINFAKPVYLEVRNSQTDQNTTIERYDPNVDNQYNIVGKAPFQNGLDHTTIYPGGYAKFALSFDYSNRYNGVKAIEVGALVDIYPVGLPMMADNKYEQVFPQLYVKYVFGKKWF